MQACKSKYDYIQLCYNYLEANIYDQLPVADKYTSTANDRMSFNNDLLVSYNTFVARIVKGTTAIYLLITSERYSVTTTTHLNTLKRVADQFPVKIIYTSNIWNTLPKILDEYMQLIHKFYTEKLLHIRKPENYTSTLLYYRETIEQLYPEVSKEKMNEYIIQLNKYPSIPKKLNKFTKTALREHMTNQGLL